MVKCGRCPGARRGPRTPISRRAAYHPGPKPARSARHDVWAFQHYPDRLGRGVLRRQAAVRPAVVYAARSFRLSRA